MKFDCIIMNPPYKCGLGTKILHNIIENKVAKQIVSIQPAGIFTSPTKHGEKSRTGLRDHLRHIEYVDGNRIWGKSKGVIFKSVLGIFDIDTTQCFDQIKINNSACDMFDSGTYVSCSLEGTVYGSHKIYSSILNKVSNLNLPNINSIARPKTIDPLKTHVKIGEIVGGINGSGKSSFFINPDFFGIGHKGTCKIVTGDVLDSTYFESRKIFNVLCVNNDNEGHNMVSYLFSPVLNLIVSGCKR